MRNAAQNQRRLAAKTARRKAVVTQKRSLEASSTSLVGRVRVAAKGAIIKCTRTETLFEIGIGHVIVARALPTGLIGCAHFLVDTFCLGIKDVFYIEVSRSELSAHLDEQDSVDRLIDIEPAYARKLILDAAAYAAGFGLAAAQGTPAIEAIFGDVDPGACTHTFTFGQDGEPCFIAGPNDTPARVRAIRKILEKSHGGGGLVDAEPERAFLTE